MKRKELYNYIREEIISELSEGQATDAARDAGASNPAAAAKTALDAARKDKTGTATIVGPKGTKVIDKATSLEEDNIDELANIANILKIQDTDKFALAKEIYTGGRTAAILSALEEAGDEGITPQALAEKIGAKSSNEINLIINNLRAAGVISGKREIVKPEKGAKPEEPEVEEPETEEPETSEEPETDDWEKPEEEEPETGEEEPVTTTKASDNLGKYAEELAGLKKQLKTVMDKYRDASGKISDIEKYKQEIGNLPQQIKALQAKIDRYSE